MTNVQNSSFGSVVKNTATAATLGAGVGATYSYLKQANAMKSIDTWVKSAKTIDPKNAKALKDVLKNAPTELKNLLKNVDANSFKETLKNIPDKMKDIVKNIDTKPIKDGAKNIFTKATDYVKKLGGGNINWQQVGKTAGKGALIGAGVIAGLAILKSIFGGNK